MAAKIIFLVVVLLISIYTLSYMVWLWRKKMKKGAMGVLLLVLASIFYPVFVLFFVWGKFG